MLISMSQVSVDLLIGAQLFWYLTCVSQIKACKAHATLQKPKLDWVISGTTYGSPNKIAAALCHLAAVDKLNESISRFWEVEHDISFNNTSHSREYTLEERSCEVHFQQNVRRNAVVS